MIISNFKKYNEAFVWIWLPEETSPVVAGKLTQHENALVFNYGKSYLERIKAIPIYESELPLRSGVLPLLSGMSMPSCIRDASPDAWGRRVIINKMLRVNRGESYSVQLDELTYLLHSGSDRIGALDFQLSATHYVPRLSSNVSLEELIEAAECVEKGLPLSESLNQALNHGTSIGGARPKALIETGQKKYVAKFSSSSDLYSVVKAEFIAMRLARKCGLSVASVSLIQSLHKDVLLIERFDRVLTLNGWQRKCMVSCLTLLELDEMMARYASYERFAEIVRYRFVDARRTLKELFGRIIFNILCGNTDDHARNHAAFWDGKMLSLTPAYDLCPQNRTGNEATQAMLIAGDSRMSKVSVCIDAAHNFLLTEKEAMDIILNQIEVIADSWELLCEEADITEIDKRFMWGRQFLNLFAFEGLEGERAFLRQRADDVLSLSVGGI